MGYSPCCTYHLLCAQRCSTLHIMQVCGCGVCGGSMCVEKVSPTRPPPIPHHPHQPLTPPPPHLHTPTDYNGSWLLTSKRRTRYLYAMFNLRDDKHTRHFCEHQSRFDMLRILVEYLLRQQAGMGVVAVSPLYAPRVHQKFSQFWLYVGGWMGCGGDNGVYGRMSMDSCTHKHMHNLMCLPCIHHPHRLPKNRMRGVLNGVYGCGVQRGECIGTCHPLCV